MLFKILRESELIVFNNNNNNNYKFLLNILIRTLQIGCRGLIDVGYYFNEYFIKEFLDNPDFKFY